MAEKKLHLKKNRPGAKATIRSAPVKVEGKPIRAHRKGKTETPYQTQRRTKRLRSFEVGYGLPKISAMLDEIIDMEAVLLGRKEPPVDNGPMTLMVVADAYSARAAELTRMILTREREGHVDKGSPYYKFRTGELRTFFEMAKRATDLGSRFLSAEQLEFEQAKYGRDLYSGS